MNEIADKPIGGPGNREQMASYENPPELMIPTHAGFAPLS